MLWWPSPWKDSHCYFITVIATVANCNVNACSQWSQATPVKVSWDSPGVTTHSLRTTDYRLTFLGRHDNLCQCILTGRVYGVQCDSVYMCGQCSSSQIQESKERKLWMKSDYILKISISYNEKLRKCGCKLTGQNLTKIPSLWLKFVDRI